MIDGGKIHRKYIEREESLKLERREKREEKEREKGGNFYSIVLKFKNEAKSPNSVCLRSLYRLLP